MLCHALFELCGLTVMDDPQDLMYLSHIGLVGVLREYVESHGRSLHLSSPHTRHRSHIRCSSCTLRMLTYADVC